MYPLFVSRFNVRSTLITSHRRASPCRLCSPICDSKLRRYASAGYVEDRKNSRRNARAKFSPRIPLLSLCFGLVGTEPEIAEERKGRNATPGRLIITCSAMFLFCFLDLILMRQKCRTGPADENRLPNRVTFHFRTSIGLLITFPMGCRYYCHLNFMNGVNLFCSLVFHA